MKLYRKVDDEGYFIEDVFLEEIPYLTETVVETVTDDDGITSNVYITKNVLRDVIDSNIVVGREPVLDHHYIEVPCPEGFILGRWLNDRWIEGGTAPIETPDQEIKRLKEELNATDYKVIKCSECQLIGEELPYNIVELHALRQNLRNRINELESL